MQLFLGLLSLAGFSCVLGVKTNKSLSAMPLVTVAGAMLLFTLAGMAGLLLPVGVAWYAGAALCWGWLLLRWRNRLVASLTPGFLCFVALSALAIAVFCLTQPMLTQWDEFTFWGTAAKATSETNQLYTVADSNLIARSYPPGLIVFSYAMQLCGPFTEYGLMAAFALVYIACFAAGTALLDKHRAAAVVLMGALVLLPFLFEADVAAGSMSFAYLTCYADPALAALFGGALALYFGGGKKDSILYTMLAVVLCALANIKDMGLALAAVALLIVAADSFFTRRREIKLCKLKGAAALALLFLGGLVLIVGVYFGWAGYYGAAVGGASRTTIGSGGEGMSVAQMIPVGILALLGINRTEQFGTVLADMLRALYSRPVWLLGSGLRMLALILVLSAFAWLLYGSKKARRRVLVFTAVAFVGFVAFYIFNIFTYSYVFSAREAAVLKDYDRYIYPYWQGWLAAALMLLGGAVAQGKPWRANAARLTNAMAALFLVAVVALRGNGQANVFRVSESLYGERWDVQSVAAQAGAEGLQSGHRVYYVSQYDSDAVRYYLFGYELPASIVYQYGGEQGGEAIPALGVRLMAGESPYAGEVYCTPAQLSAFLESEGATHILLDAIDDEFVLAFKDMFTDGLPGWDADGEYRGGARYYAIEYTAAGAVFSPAGEVAV